MSASLARVLIFFALLMPQSAFARCVLCKGVLAQTAGEGLVRGFYWCTVILVSIPLIIFALIGFFVIRCHRKNHV